MKVFKPGTKVTIGGSLQATVRQVCIAGDGVTYECVWWSERTRNVAWLADHEVSSAGDSPKMLIGFRANGHPNLDMGVSVH